MMNKVQAAPREYASTAEKEIAEFLVKTLAAPWKLQPEVMPMEVPSAGGGLRYVPDFLIVNEATGDSLSVEVKSSRSLSMPNLIKFHDIQTAIEGAGARFLLLVHADSPDAASAKSRLGEFGVRAATVRSAADAAHVIEEQLSTEW